MNIKQAINNQSFYGRLQCLEELCLHLQMQPPTVYMFGYYVTAELYTFVISYNFTSVLNTLQCIRVHFIPSINIVLHDEEICK